MVDNLLCKVFDLNNYKLLFINKNILFLLFYIKLKFVLVYKGFRFIIFFDEVLYYWKMWYRKVRNNTQQRGQTSDNVFYFDLLLFCLL